MKRDRPQHEAARGKPSREPDPFGPGHGEPEGGVPTPTPGPEGRDSALQRSEIQKPGPHHHLLRSSYQADGILDQIFEVLSPRAASEEDPGVSPGCRSPFAQECNQPASHEGIVPKLLERSDVRLPHSSELRKIGPEPEKIRNVAREHDPAPGDHRTHP